MCKRGKALVGREREKGLSLSITKLLDQLSSSQSCSLVKFDFKAVLISNSSL